MRSPEIAFPKVAAMVAAENITPTNIPMAALHNRNPDISHLLHLWTTNSFPSPGTDDS
jgi:hypothetical protein